METHDVLLLYHGADKAAVEAIAARLYAAGLQPLLNEWGLVPGKSFISGLEREVDVSRAVAMFFGPAGINAWQDEEKQLALEFVTRAQQLGRPVIPVILHGASREDVGFIRLQAWVELGEEDGFGKLVAEIKGRSLGPPSHPTRQGEYEARGDACAESLREGRPPQSMDPVTRAPTEEELEQLIGALSEVFSDPDEAKLLAGQAGFPREDLPAFKTARVFWSLVVQAIVDGRTEKGVRAVAAAAAKLYPANAIFTKYQAKTWAGLRIGATFPSKQQLPNGITEYKRSGEVESLATRQNTQEAKPLGKPERKARLIVVGALFVIVAILTAEYFRRNSNAEHSEDMPMTEMLVPRHAEEGASGNDAVHKENPTIKANPAQNSSLNKAPTLSSDDLLSGDGVKYQPDMIKNHEHNDREVSVRDAHVKPSPINPQTKRERALVHVRTLISVNTEGLPVLDITLRNRGSEVHIVTRVSVKLERRWHVGPIWWRPLPLEVSRTYDIAVPNEIGEMTSAILSQELRPQTADRFELVLGSAPHPHWLPPFGIYPHLLHITLHYNEASKIELPPICVLIPPPIRAKAHSRLKPEKTDIEAALEIAKDARASIPEDIVLQQGVHDAIDAEIEDLESKLARLESQEDSAPVEAPSRSP